MIAQPFGVAEPLPLPLPLPVSTTRAHTSMAPAGPVYPVVQTELLFMHSGVQ
jgi:hypothetical protein